MKHVTRVYVCHTFYHVYIAYLKECALQKADKEDKTLDKADILLSTMSNDFSGPNGCNRVLESGDSL